MGVTVVIKGEVSLVFASASDGRDEGVCVDGKGGVE